MATSDYTLVDLSRFWSKIDTTNHPGGCWIWTANRNRSGYGVIKWHGRAYYAHRFAYLTFIGPIPDGLLVCHTCDTPACVYPAHLFVGTDLDNQRDKWDKGRGTPMRGENHPEHKLTDAQVAELRQRFAAGGVLQKALAHEYGISRPQVCRIIKHNKR